jgi:hypothetical protein
MKTTFGQFNPDGGEGFLRPVYFPSLATMNSRTGDGRLLREGGGGVYGSTLPRPIMAQTKTMPGHLEANAVGSLQEVTLHEDGNISGRGWLADIPAAHDLVTLVKTQSVFHNSIDLADVEVIAEWESDDPNDPGYNNLLVDFTKWRIAATTFVPTPAFANAHGTLDAPSDEIRASAMLVTDEPLEVSFEATDFRIVENAEEVTAALALAGATEPFDAYHRPEPTVFTKSTVDAEGNVYGHLAPWGKCHDGVQGRCVLAPKPAHYGDFHQGAVLTERGLVDTAVIFFLGGHPDKPLAKSEASKAYGGVENAWAKVRVINGRLGPWYCGRVMSGLSPEALELARATPVSGHWRDDKTLAAIVSVNVPGFRIPGTDRTFDSDGVSFDSEGRRHDLVASLHVEPASKQRPTAQEMIDALGGITRWQSMTPITQGINTSGNIQYTTTSGDTMAGELEIAEALEAAVDEACGAPDHRDTLDRLAMLVEVELELGA